MGCLGFFSAFEVRLTHVPVSVSALAGGRGRLLLHCGVRGGENND